MACSSEDSCDTNSDLNGDCFNLDLTLSTQSINTSALYTRENLQLIFQFPPSGPQERVRFVVRSDDNSQSSFRNDTLFFTKGLMYSGTGSCTFNGDLSSGGIPCNYEYMFSKIDRKNNTVSGTIDFSYSNDFGSDKFSSNFENVEVKGEDF
jgi:hypothetical protein